MALAQTLPLEPFESISYCHRPNGGRDKALIYWVMAEDWDPGGQRSLPRCAQCYGVLRGRHPLYQYAPAPPSPTA